MEKKSIMSGFVIVIADRGWVYIGDCTMDDDGCRIEAANNIRRWGTSKGLGELAKNGPTETTKLDFYGTVYIPKNSIISIIDAEKESWKK